MQEPQKISRYICSYDLPPDVFGPEERRPSRLKKKIAKKSEPTGAKRRLDVSEVEVCVSNGPFKRGAASKAWKEIKQMPREFKNTTHDRIWGIANDKHQLWVGILSSTKRLEATTVR